MTLQLSKWSTAKFFFSCQNEPLPCYHLGGLGVCRSFCWGRFVDQKNFETWARSPKRYTQITSGLMTAKTCGAEWGCQDWYLQAKCCPSCRWRTEIHCFSCLTREHNLQRPTSGVENKLSWAGIRLDSKAFLHCRSGGHWRFSAWMKLSSIMMVPYQLKSQGESVNQIHSSHMSSNSSKPLSMYFLDFFDTDIYGLIYFRCILISAMQRFWNQWTSLTISK